MVLEYTIGSLRQQHAIVPLSHATTPIPRTCPHLAPPPSATGSWPGGVTARGLRSSCTMPYSLRSLSLSARLHSRSSLRALSRVLIPHMSCAYIPPARNPCPIIGSPPHPLSFNCAPILLPLLRLPSSLPSSTHTPPPSVTARTSSLPYPFLPSSFTHCNSPSSVDTPD